MFFVVYKGAKGLELDNIDLDVAFAYAFGLGGGIGLLTIPTMIPYMKRMVNEKFNEDGTLRKLVGILITSSVHTILLSVCYRGVVEGLVFREHADLELFRRLIWPRVRRDYDFERK